MPTNTDTARQHIVVARLMLNVTRAIATTYLDAEQFGSAATDVLLVCSAYIGQFEGRPMTAGKLSAYIGVPRSTVIRRLRDLSTRGLVVLGDDGTATLPTGERNICDQTMVALVRRAAADLARMDTKNIALQKATE